MDLTPIIKRAGGGKALAAALGIVPSAVSHWKRRGNFPLRLVPKVAEAAGMTPHEIRPDFFPPPAITKETV